MSAAVLQKGTEGTKVRAQTDAIRWWFGRASKYERLRYLIRLAAMDCVDGGGRVSTLLGREAREPVGLAAVDSLGGKKL